MRILLLGTAAIALSGCSWFGGSNYYGPQAHQGQGYYANTPANTGGACCDNLSKWNVEGAVGQEFMVGGDFTTPGDVTALPGVTLPEVSMKDAYDAGMRYELGLSKTLNPNRKFTLMGSYSTAEGKDVAIASSTATPADQIRGKASDYTTYGIEAGLRQYFAPSRAPLVKAIRPYIEGKVGAVQVDDINLTNARTVGGAPGVVNGGTIAMYEGGWVPTAAGMVGIEAPIFKRATLGLETGIRYRGALDGDQTDLGTGGGLAALNGLNNGSENWSVPVTLRGRFRF